MKRKHRRLTFAMIGVGALALATGLVLYGLRRNVSFFYSPTQIAKGGVPLDRDIRIGGLVEKGTVKVHPDGHITFKVTDTNKDVPVTYKGILPDLFREGQGVVAEGDLSENGTFVATDILAKHDEKYMPPEVAAALKKQGYWEGKKK